jgi:release factor glutamine methyltransferase
MKYLEALKFATDALTQAKVPSPQSDAHWLLCHACALSRSELMTKLSFDPSLTDSEFEKLRDSLALRVNRVPLQHIVGSAGFLDFELLVGPGVFVPRPETEQVAALGIEFLSASAGPKRILDIGTGSGAIAIAIARANPEFQVIAIEVSEPAANYARENILNLAPSVELRVGDFTALVSDLVGELDLLISNPPYIPQAARPIDPEVSEHDPELALYSGEDGLDMIREIVALAPVLLKPQGRLILEHADGQSDLIRELLLAQSAAKVLVHSDLAGRLRSVSASW